MKPNLLFLIMFFSSFSIFAQERVKKMKVNTAMKKILKMIPEGTHDGINPNRQVDCEVEIKKHSHYFYVNVDHTDADDRYGIALYLPSSFPIKAINKKNFLQIIDAEGTEDSANGPYEVIDSVSIKKISKKWSLSKKYRVTGSWETTLDRDDYVENVCDIVIKKK